MSESRIEKKFVLGKFKDDFLKKFLLINGFTKHYPDRKINSVYLDTNNYDFARDNINGVSERKKIRFRWYNDDETKIFFEEKNKKNFFVWKNIKEIKLSNDKKELVNRLKDFFFSMKPSNTNNFNYKFILKTNYKRSYWISDDKKFRATIDTDINTSALEKFIKPVYLSDTVLEFKFSPQYESKFRYFFNSRSYQLRSQKYSKYIRSFITLENSGFFI
tara:strand:+ start:3946 stop:4599 length:654 start_codon:yes stop_codon:yes gene_type:complete